MDKKIPLLELSGIGKIYVSEGNVAVGIRGVSLAFDKGEFVAVTGMSGSGKSTLLNVISGMDSYEEGELFISGEPTSHYLEPDWEEYRAKYISFIFQDYNIIESFTVLENVELALMHIKDKRLRRERALELIERVGLTSHIKHKGSALSGGQKQRTVIARALAKDSPIILADEPCGNLDAQSSREIVDLLYEVSRDKLVIVVTHSFDELREVATRHVRVFNGEIEADEALSPTLNSDGARGRGAEESFCGTQSGLSVCAEGGTRGEKYGLWRAVSDGATLGAAIFRAKPKLSAFLSLLLIVGAIGVFALTSLCSSAWLLFEPYYMFENIPGRVVVTTRDDSVATEDEIKALAEKYGAEFERVDALRDVSDGFYAYFNTGESYVDYTSVLLHATYDEEPRGKIVGRKPERAGEVLLSLPVSYKTSVGAKEILADKLFYLGMELRVVGVHYYADNNITPRAIFTKEGYDVATASYFAVEQGAANIKVTAFDTATGRQYQAVLGALTPVFTEERGIYISDKEFEKLLQTSPGIKLSVDLTSSTYSYSDFGTTMKVFTSSFDEGDLMKNKPECEMKDIFYGSDSALYIDANTLLEIVMPVLQNTYRQFSLYFESEGAARAAAEEINGKTYVAVCADTTYEPSVIDVILNLILGITMAVVFVLGIVFMAFFINLCTQNGIRAFKSDMAIMRSMGIPVITVRAGMYVRMLISLIPAVLAVSLLGILISVVPVINGLFTYLYLWQYLLIFFGLIFLTMRITHKQIKNLFGTSVKSAIRGGGEND